MELFIPRSVLRKPSAPQPKSFKRPRPAPDPLRSTDGVLLKSADQRAPETGEPVCVVCGKFGEYVCDQTDQDVCSLECKEIHLGSRDKFSSIIATTPPNPQKDSNRTHGRKSNDDDVIPASGDIVFDLYQPRLELNEQQVSMLRVKMQISIRAGGDAAPSPISSFEDIVLPAPLLENIASSGYVHPTPVQMQTIPTCLKGRDVVVCAQTGSGKTASFLIPVLAHCIANLKRGESKPHGATMALILCPTRELCVQIESQARMLVQGGHIRTGLIVGGYPLPPQLHRLSKGCEFVVATPGRLLCCLQRTSSATTTTASNSSTNNADDDGDDHDSADHDNDDEYANNTKQKHKNNPDNNGNNHHQDAGKTDQHKGQRTWNLEWCHVVVLDEVDMMLQLGFDQQVTNILDNLPLPRQTLMFSATLSRNVSKLTPTLLQKAIHITVGEAGTAVHNVHQIALWTGNNNSSSSNNNNKNKNNNNNNNKNKNNNNNKIDGDTNRYEIDMAKKRKLIEVLHSVRHYHPPCVIFVASRLGAEALGVEIEKDTGMSVCVVHGDQPQSQRNQGLAQFVQGHVPILVATNLLGRGLDLIRVNQVICYDMPHSVSEYVHQIGRAGRLGAPGHAIVFVNNADARLFVPLYQQLKSSPNHVIPMELEKAVAVLLPQQQQHQQQHQQQQNQDFSSNTTVPKRTRHN